MAGGKDGKGGKGKGNKANKANKASKPVNGVEAPLIESILDTLSRPEGHEVAAARKRAGLTQAQAARLVGSLASRQPYRTWQSYEVGDKHPGGRQIPMATWALFLLLTHQHPTLKVTQRRGVAMPADLSTAVCVGQSLDSPGPI